MTAGRRPLPRGDQRNRSDALRATDDLLVTSRSLAIGVPGSFGDVVVPHAPPRG